MRSRIRRICLARSCDNRRVEGADGLLVPGATVVIDPRHARDSCRDRRARAHRDVPAHRRARAPARRPSLDRRGRRCNARAVVLDARGPRRPQQRSNGRPHRVARGSRRSRRRVRCRRSGMGPTRSGDGRTARDAAREPARSTARADRQSPRALGRRRDRRRARWNVDGATTRTRDPERRVVRHRHRMELQECGDPGGIGDDDGPTRITRDVVRLADGSIAYTGHVHVGPASASPVVSSRSRRSHNRDARSTSSACSPAATDRARAPSCRLC